LISTYEMGRQPFGLASPAAWLVEAGLEVTTVDTTRQPLTVEAVREARLVAFHLPMHTATRLAVPIVRRVREWNPAAHLCAYGLYAPLNESLLRSLAVQTVLGGEFEADLLRLARELALGEEGTCAPGATLWLHAADLAAGEKEGRPGSSPGRRPVPRVQFRVPDRRGLPALSRYASLQLPQGERRIVGYTEASRGCKHRCRHCPVVPVYQGAFRLVPPEIVLADIRSQVAAGAQHITFGDPDFFNAVRHALAIVEGLAREWPDVTYDVTIKIEHLLRQADVLPRLRDTGCLFVTSAVESVDDRVLQRLEKHHTAADFAVAVRLCREAGLVLAPTFVPFTPWTTLEGYGGLLETVEALDVVEHVAPIQLAIRLLIPEGSLLLELDDVRGVIGPFDHGTLAYPWRHVDPRVDALQVAVMDLVGARLNAPRREMFEAVCELASSHGGRSRRVSSTPLRPRATIPYLNEPWYC
jgi:radical SAM superfamily enzyme YgiQ (UPF0313 family)